MKTLPLPEAAALMDDEPPDSYFDDDPPEDEFEQAIGDCHMFCDGGRWVCGAVGSEHCDFDCPFNRDLGKRCK